MERGYSGVPEDNESRIQILIRDHFERTVRVVTLISGSAEVAEDAVQEAVARAWERLDRGSDIEHLDHWVMTVALNYTRSWFRKLRSERSALDRLASRAEHERDPSSTVADVLLFESALRALPRRQREVTVLRYYAGQSVDEIACTIGRSAGAVKHALHSARKALESAVTSEEHPTRKG